MNYDVIPAAPGWQAVFADPDVFGGDDPLPDEVRLEPHVYLLPIVAWHVCWDDAEDPYLRPLVAKFSDVFIEEPDLVLAPGDEIESHRRYLTHLPKKEATR